MAKPDPKLVLDPKPNAPPPNNPGAKPRTISAPVVIREGAGWSLYLVELPESQVKAGQRVHGEDMRSIVEGKALRILEGR